MVNKDMTNPTEKIKKIEKELIALKGLDTESEPCWAFRDVEASIFKLEAKLQVYKEWVESLKDKVLTNPKEIEIYVKARDEGFELGKEQSKAEILEMIDKWQNNSIFKYDDECSYCQRSINNWIIKVRELKSKITGEKLK